MPPVSFQRALRWTPLLGLAACGTVDTPAPVPGELGRAEFHLEGEALHGPDTVMAGATVVSLSVAESGLDQVALVQLGPDHTAAEFLSATEVHLPPFWATFAGGPNQAVPGRPAEATVALTPGSWLVMAFDIGPGGFPRVRPRATRPLTVVPSPRPAPPPETVYWIRMFDYGFLISGPIVAGTHAVVVSNLAPQRHEAILVRLGQDRRADEMAEYLLARRRGDPWSGPVPGEVVAAVGALSQSQRNYTTITVRPGVHALICLLAADADGRPHSAHGHLHTFDVVTADELLRQPPQ